MKQIKISDVQDYVEQNIGKFHQNRLDKLKKLQLDIILKRKNPYLFKAKNILIAEALVRTFLDAFLSSQEEANFGDFLESLAIFINGRVFSGKKSSSEGIDLEFERDDKRYIVNIKSGPNWGNSSQIRKMREDFTKAKRILRTTKSNIEIVAVNGCCYGQDSRPDKGDYFKYCGQRFWEFISGNNNLYLNLIVPLGYRAKQKNDEFNEEYAKIINRFTVQFSEKFCIDGKIDWESLVKFNSSASK